MGARAATAAGTPERIGGSRSACRAILAADALGEVVDAPDSDEHASSLPSRTAGPSLDKGRRALVDEFASENLPKGRTHELEIAVTRSLRAIAGRVDHGYNIAVRVGTLPPADEGEEGELTTDSELDTERRELEDRIRAVEERTCSLTFMNLSGSRILSLDRSMDADEDGSSPRPDGPPRRRR
jgi:hypothetical protein